MEPDRNNNDPLFHAPFQQPPESPGIVTSSSPQSDLTPETNPPKSKLLLIIGVAAVLELMVIIGLAVAVVANSNPQTANDPKSNSETSQAEGPTAATSSSVQLVDDSISQDTSSLNDDKDFPDDKFNDRSLNL